MEAEYLAIIITISVLGGVVFIAFLAVCITKITVDNTVKKSFARTQAYGETVQQPSYVRYNDPEPHSPTYLNAEDTPWQSSYHNNPVLDEYPEDSREDVLDHSMFPLPSQDIPRRPSNAQYRQPIIQNMPNIPPSSSYIQDLPHNSSYLQDMPRRTSYAQDMPQRLLNVQGMPRTRHSYAPEISRRPSNAIQRSSSMGDQFRPRPHSAEPSSGEKLWYNYLKDDPDYFTEDAIEWNKKQPRIWRKSRGRYTPSFAPHHAISERESEAPQNYYHRQAANRLSWI